jgi:hypothetical protein
MVTVIHRNGESIPIEEGVDAYVGHGLPNLPARGELRVRDAQRQVIASFKADEWSAWFPV